MPKNWCFWIVVLRKTLEGPLDRKEIKPVNPKENQPWIFIERTDAKAEALTVWPPDIKSWLIGKDTDAGKDWEQEEKKATEDEMVGCHHQLKGQEFEQTPRAKYREAWGVAVHWVAKSWTQLSNWATTTIRSKIFLNMNIMKKEMKNTKKEANVTEEHRELEQNFTGLV